MDQLTKTINQLPKVLQQEIWEYVRGDRAFWKQQFTGLNQNLEALFALFRFMTDNWENENWFPVASDFKRKPVDDVKFDWDPPVTPPAPSFLDAVSGFLDRIFQSIFNLWWTTTPFANELS